MTHDAFVLRTGRVEVLTKQSYRLLGSFIVGRRESCGGTERDLALESRQRFPRVSRATRLQISGVGTRMRSLQVDHDHSSTSRDPYAEQPAPTD